MSNKILLAIAFTCVVSSYNITSATISTYYKTNITEIRETDCQIFEKKISRNDENKSDGFYMCFMRRV